MENNETDLNLENNYKKSILYIFLIIVALIVGTIFLNKKHKYDDYELKVESTNNKYNSNEVKFSYNENDDIKKIIFYLDDKQLEIKNGDSFKVNDIMDGSEHKIKIIIYYSDGEEEIYNYNYKIYSECDKNVKTAKKETSCDNNENTFIIKKTIVDEKTKKLCSESTEEYQCSENEIINDDSNNDNSNNSNNDKVNNDDLNKNESNNKSNNNSEINNNENNSPNDNNLTDSMGCDFVISKGIKGVNNWYISDVTIKLNIFGKNVSKYGISTSDTVDYNSKKEYKISKDISFKKYYGFVKYKDGKTAKCNITLNIDKNSPTIPTSEIRKTNSSGEKISNSSNYRNYRVWWGNFNSNDNGSGVDRYEFSTGCTENVTGILKGQYLYPSSSNSKYSGKYCIRSIDKAGNTSKWSSPYYFYVDLVKPTCSVTMAENGSSTTLIVAGKDSESGVSKYSYNGSSFDNNNTYKISNGTKVNVRIQDNAGNIGSCTNYKDILILLGDSRTRHLQRDLGGKRVLSDIYNDIYYVETYDNDTKEVYAVAMSGASKNWLLGKNGESYDSGAYQVQELLTMLSKNNYYSDIIIATNLGVNDLHSFTPEKAFGVYTSAYEKLLKSSQSVIVKSQTKSASWKKSKNVIKINLYFISVNPIDEKLLNAYVPTNKRTLSSIISYNLLMKNYFGNKYIDSYSQFNNWFNAALKNGENRYVIGDCYNSNNQLYKCEDGLHYSKYINTKLLYSFYKEKLFIH